MRKTEKVGRNESCPCGSGKKYKRCCEARDQKGGLGNRFLVVGLLCALVGALLLGFASFNSDSSSTGPRRVWSQEHGHYHDVP